MSAALLAHLLAVLALAASPGLHHWLHGDAADADDHDCAVVLYLHGGADEAAGPLPAPGFIVRSVVFSPPVAMATAEFVPTVFAAGAVFEHGPPAVGLRQS